MLLKKTGRGARASYNYIRNLQRNRRYVSFRIDALCNSAYIRRQAAFRSPTWRFNKLQLHRFANIVKELYAI